METSKNIDRERRRVESRKRWNWAKALIRPRTIKVLIEVGRWLTQVVYIAFAIIKFLRE